MGRVIEFKSPLEKITQETTNPYQQHITTSYYLSAPHISAMNFFYLFFNIPLKHPNEKAAYFLNSTLEFSSKLYEYGQIDPLEKREWNLDPTPKINLTQTLFDPKFHSQILTDFPNKGMSHSRINQLSLDITIDELTKALNGKETRLKIPPFSTLRKDAMREQNSTKLQFLNAIERKEEDWDLYFGPAKNWNEITFYYKKK